MRVVNIIIVFVFGLVVAGCSTSPVIQPSLAPSDTTGAVRTALMTSTITSMTNDAITPTPNTQPEQAAEERTVYTFDVDLDYNKHSLDVRQTIHYKNQTGRELTEIVLMVPSNEQANVFSLTSLILTGDVGFAENLHDGVILTILFDRPLPNTGNLDIYLEYTLTPRLQGGILGYTAKRLNVSDWYPFVPPYDAENGWISHQPAEVGEYLVYDSADFDLTLNLVNATGLTIAASAGAAPIDMDTYHILAENRRGLTFSVSDHYTLITKTTDDGVTVKGYIFIGDENAGQAAVDYTASALQLYSELFGLPYPYKTLSVVESDFPDGMEYDGLYYLSDFYFKTYDGTFQNYLALLSVHETSHQWWFGAVANDQALEPWLDESLATYSEYLFIERYYPELVNWWWDYRINYYQPSGRMNMTIYDQSDLRVYINAVYLQGAVFLDQLRQALGDEAFFTGLRIYTNTYNHQIANWEDFIKIMEPESSDAVNALIQEYYD
jgi:hypothetical protein